MPNNCAAADDHQQDTAKWHYALFYFESNVYMDIVYRLCSNNFIHTLYPSLHTFLLLIYLQVGFWKDNNLRQDIYNPQILDFIPLIFDLSVHVNSVASCVWQPVMHHICNEIILAYLRLATWSCKTLTLIRRALKMLIWLSHVNDVPGFKVAWLSNGKATSLAE